MKKGFTIIETLVAISILLIAIAGPLTIAAKGLFSSYYSRDEVTAFYLAQEGIEYFRNLRDTNTLNGQPWDSNFVDSTGQPCSLDNPCRIDVTNGDLTNGDLTNPVITSCQGDHHLPGLICEPLKLDSTGSNPTNLYQYNAGNDTNFTREISVIQRMDISNNLIPEYEIISTVHWVSPLPNNSITLSEDITDWQQP